MPHIKVTPFDTKKLHTLSNLEFHGVVEDGNNEILMLKKGDNTLFFDLIKRDKEYLIKANKIAKGSQTELIKHILNEIVSTLDLNILISNTNVKSKEPKHKSIYLKSIEDFYAFKTDFKKVKLEVGFGSGRHLLYRAENEKDTLFIGIEIHTPSINQTLKHIELKGLNNVLILNYDARLLLELLPSNILDKIYVHFPVPWDKKPHRRVISDKFVKESIRVLKKDVALELRTDSIKYYEYALEVFSKPKVSKFNVEKNIDIEVRSKYEDRWRRMQKDIYTLTFFALEDSDSKILDINFNFNAPKNSITFSKDSIVLDEFFVHFGKKYKSLKDDSMVVECAFGSFSMPEKKMLYINSSSCRYYPTLPVKTIANFKAHKYIKEVVDGRSN